MKPKLNQIVYTLIIKNNKPYCLNKEHVYMLSKESFITKQAIEYGVIDECRIAFNFDSYNITWFTTLQQAKESLESMGYKLEKYGYPEQWTCYKG
jgi:hypothetical protein